MYLTEIDEKTGFVDISDVNDGVLAIKEFRAIIENPDLGVECFTAIALVADHLSPIRFYPDNDRPLAAMEQVMGNRRAWEWNIEPIQLALKYYDFLQYNPELEEGRIHRQRKIARLKELEEVEEYAKNPPKDADDNPIPFRKPDVVSRELRQINADIKAYEESIQGKDVYSSSPVKGKYLLTRLEQKALKQRSFYYEVR